MKNLITVLFFCSLSHLSFGQFNAADLHSEVTKVQPMTGIVFWSENSGDLNTLGNKVQLEYSYLVYADVIQNAGVYNWSIVDNLLASAANNGRQMIIRFRYTYPGVTSPSVPNYIRNSPGYQNQVLSVEGSSTYIPDWSSQELQDFTKEFFTAFSVRYDNDPRLAFLQIGFGSYSEYHLYDGPLNLGQTFPSKSYQTEFLNHVNGLFQATQWGMSIDAASSSRTPIAADNLQSLNYGLFDDSFLHETHSANNSEYNRASWLFFGTNKYETNAAGGELNYYSQYDQENVLAPNGPWGTSFEELSELYNISYMIGNDQLNYQPASRIESAGMATGYRFSVEGYETDGSMTRATIRNTGIAPVYYDAYPSIGGVRSNSSLKGLLPNQVQEFIIATGSVGEDLEIECDRLSPGQEIQFDANIDGSNECDVNLVGTACNDGDACTTGETYNANCDCTGGIDICNGDDCITIDGNLNDWATINTLSSNAGFTLKAADDNNTLYISVAGSIGESGEGYQIFIDTDNDNSGSNEFLYYSNWSQTRFNAMIENGSFSNYTGTGNDWLWSAETPILNAKTTAGIELKIDKSLLNASSSTIRIGFASLSNWEGVNFVPSGNTASAYTLSALLNCDNTCPDADGDAVCDEDDVCPNMDDALIGTACDDGDVCTTDDVYDGNCNCTGTLLDDNNNNVCDLDECINVALYVYLEGAYDAATGQMNTPLNTALGLLPGQTPSNALATPTPAGQPYTSTPWNYNGGEGSDWTDVNYSTDMVDWVLVSFRTGIEANTTVSQAAGMLNKDGSIAFSTCALPNQGYEFLYVVVQHRNHIGIMSPSAIPITNNGLNYDFSLADSYKDASSYGQKLLTTGKWAMLAGDIDQSDLAGYDINGADKAAWLPDNGLFERYSNKDANLDGDINGGDKALWNGNNGVFSKVPK